jgi:membrane protease YdiL (CAAX protease family)
MQDIKSLRLTVVSDLLIIVGLSALGMGLFSWLGMYLAHILTGIPVSDITLLIQDYETMEGARTALLVLQACISLGSFLLLPGLILFFRKPAPFETASIPLNPKIWGLVALLALLMMPVNAWLALWNESVYFPSFFGNLEKMALEKEEELKNLTLFLVGFENTFELILGFAVIAFLAGLTEEFFFRKLIQPRMMFLFGNVNTGIWITAFLFSAIHGQFYGLIPRMVLGALFGYYYLWTGSIGVPILAHTLNNFITLTALLLYRLKISSVDIENAQSIPWIISAFAAALCLNLALVMRQKTMAIRAVYTGPGRSENNQTA